jgi:hypothetical protein
VAVSAAEETLLRSVSGAVPCAPAPRATRRRSRKSAPAGLVRLRFIDQQNRNVIFYPVLQSTRRTKELLLLYTILQLTPAFRANEDLQQGRIERHDQAF